jgi:hypothetical protein
MDVSPTSILEPRLIAPTYRIAEDLRASDDNTQPSEADSSCLIDLPRFATQAAKNDPRMKSAKPLTLPKADFAKKLGGSSRKLSKVRADSFGSPVHKAAVTTIIAQSTPPYMVTNWTEDQLEQSIPLLWQQLGQRVSSVKETKAAYRVQLADVAARLSKLKEILCSKGRDGRWAEFLREQRIPLSSADRYVNTHRRTVREAGLKLPGEEFQELSPEEITMMVNRMVPALKKKLRTSLAITKFMEKLYDAMGDPLR